MFFSNVKSMQIPEGNVAMIMKGDVILWQEAIPLPEDLVLKLIDFEYVDNKDGTVVLTAWKETLNGISSTELVIPNDSRIIL